MAVHLVRNSLFIGIFLVSSPVTEAFLMRDILSDAAAVIGAIFGTSTDCQFKCENDATPQPRPGYTAVPNGCGSFGISMTVDGLPGFTECCNNHDLCYSRCGSDKVVCDRQFDECLARICDEAEMLEFESDDSDTCEDVASLARTAVSGSAGCVAF